jgi:ribosomal protein L35
VPGGGGYGVITDAVDLHCFCDLLNSKLLDAFLQRVTTPFHSGWFAYNKQFIEQIPIKLPTTAEDKKLGERITASVRAIMDAKGKLRGPASPFPGVKGGLKPAGLSDRETQSLEAEIEAHEKRIDEAVFPSTAWMDYPNERSPPPTHAPLLTPNPKSKLQTPKSTAGRARHVPPPLRPFVPSSLRPFVPFGRAWGYCRPPRRPLYYVARYRKRTRMATVKGKPHKGLSKRIKLSANGKPKFKKAFSGHLMSGKAGRRRQRLRRAGIITGTLADNIRRALCAD